MKNNKIYFTVAIIAAYILLFTIVSITRGDAICKKIKYLWNSVSISNEKDKIFYIKTLIDNGLYSVDKTDKIKEIINRKNINSFKNEKTKFDYSISEKNGVLSIKINNLPQAYCEAFYRDKNTIPNEGIKTILNSRNIQSINIITFDDLHKECFGNKNKIEFLIWKV